MKKFLLMAAASVLLTACSAKCNCPQCPDRTTVVTPPNSSTVVSPY